jgi:hypothetical protein
MKLRSCFVQKSVRPGGDARPAPQIQHNPQPARIPCRLAQSVSEQTNYSFQEKENHEETKKTKFFSGFFVLFVASW